jgi:hypothetical protein
MAVVYVTVGAIMAVWAAVSYVYFLNQELPAHHSGYYWCYGFFFTGLALLIIGVTLGRISRAARAAELPPPAPSEPTAEPAVSAAATTAENGHPVVQKVTPASASTPVTQGR